MANRPIRYCYPSGKECCGPWLCLAGDIGIEAVSLKGLTLGLDYGGGGGTSITGKFLSVPVKRGKPPNMLKK